MATAGIKAAAYCLNFAPELALHYGGTPAQERKSKPDSEFLRALPEHAQTYEEAQAYAPNKTYIGAMSIDELEKAPAPWIDNLGTPERFGSFGEIMPEDEFLGLMDICDVNNPFDLAFERADGTVFADCHADDGLCWIMPEDGEDISTLLQNRHWTQATERSAPL